MRTIITVALLSVCSIPALAQSDVPQPLELKDPAKIVAPESPNLHEVEVTWSRQAEPILKNRRVAPASEVKPPDQNYQAACQHGDLKRCSGVNLGTFESRIRVPKSNKMLPTLAKPPTAKINLVAETEERPMPPKKRRPKRR